MSSAFIFISGVFLGSIAGIVFTGLAASGKIEDAFHDGRRAGAYGSRGTIES